MDPNTAFESWDRCVSRGEEAEALEHAEALARWLDMGGFAPEGWHSHAARFWPWLVLARLSRRYVECPISPVGAG